VTSQPLRSTVYLANRSASEEPHHLVYLHRNGVHTSPNGIHSHHHPTSSPSTTHRRSQDRPMPTHSSALNHPPALISTHSTPALTTKPQHLGTLHTTTCTTRPSPPDPACPIASRVIFNDWLPFFVRGSGAGRRVSVVGEVGRYEWTLTWWICDGWVW
jgi:hypothetical protein